jgi:hypothetical protein
MIETLTENKNGAVFMGRRKLSHVISEIDRKQ